jgi:hypothetical protein
MCATKLQELLSTVTQNIQSKLCTQAAALEAKLTAESSKQSAESAKQSAALVATMNSKLTSAIENLAHI